MIDDRRIKTVEFGGPRGYDAGKTIKDERRHFLTDTMGSLVHALIHTTNI
jgi:hypothetical protein